MGHDKELKNFYFTFGTSTYFPYTRGQYVMVKASDRKEAAHKFMEKYPHPDCKDIVNCAFYYDESEWNSDVKSYYGEDDPVEIIE